MTSQVAKLRHALRKRSGPMPFWNDVGMPSPTIWPLEPHTAAKHALLRGYLEAWYPVLAYRNGRVLFLDGFAGPGRYEGGEPGSPLIALNSLFSHSYFPRLGRCEFVFVFNEEDPDRFRFLQETIMRFRADRSPWPGNVRVEVSNEDFAELARELARTFGRRLAPTFAFLDPFGYKGLEMRTLAELLAADKCEVFCYFDYNSANRFATAGVVDQQFEDLFGTKEFRNAPPAGDPTRGRFLVSLFERQLREVAGFTHTQTFAMRNQQGRIGHYLVFGTRSLTGLDKMKQTMWRVDPSGGYSFSDRFAGQEVLFGGRPDTKPLQDGLASTFSGQAVPIEVIIDWVISNTPYHSSHVKQATLKVMESAGQVTAGPRKKAGTFPSGCTVRFS